MKGVVGGLVLAGLFVAGCGGGGGGALHPVKGRVLVGKSPLAVKPGETALVRFHADKNAGNTEAALPQGAVAADGGYEMKTNGKAGVPAGKWIVTVVHQVEPDPSGKDPYALPKALINPDLGDVLRTYLKLEVKPDGTGEFDLKVMK